MTPPLAQLQLTDGQQYGLATVFLVGLVVVFKLLLDSQKKAIAAKNAQIADLKAEKKRLIARLEAINDAARKKDK